MWLFHIDFKDSVSSWWRDVIVEGWNGHNFMQNLQHIKEKLKIWNKASFKDIKERRGVIFSDIAKVDSSEWGVHWKQRASVK